MRMARVALGWFGARRWSRGASLIGALVGCGLMGRRMLSSYRELKGIFIMDGTATG